MHTNASTRARVAWLLVLGACHGACHKEQEKPAPPPPPEVNVATPLQQDVPIRKEIIGETRGNTEIEIRARVEGFIETIAFQQGSVVKKGDLLYTLDPRPFEANVAQAKATHAEAEAQLARGRQDVARYEPLVAKNAVSKQLYETSVAVVKAAEAAATAAKALVDRAEIDLSYTKVVAPEEGMIGKTEVYAGTLVGRGQSTLLTRISRIDPIHARANIAERDYLELARRRAATATAPGEARKETVFELVLADGTVHGQPGKLVFLDRNVDTRTGTMMFEVAFPNPGQILRPGQFARIRAQTDVARGALLVPQRAVQEQQGAYQVLVVAADDTVTQRMVMPAERVGPLWRIASGLQAEDRIIVDGLQKVRPGVKVVTRTVSIDPSESRPAEKQDKKTGGNK